MRDSRQHEMDLRILIVEDVASDAILVERELRRAQLKFTSRVIETREEFLTQLHAFIPHIILSDYTLPQFDGMTALSITREISPQVPFILITGAINEETAVECMKAGADDYILKDRLARLVPAVLASLDKRRAEEEKLLAEERLSRSEQRFRSLTENSSDIISIINAAGKIQYISPSVERVLGYSTEEVLGEDARHFIHEDDLPAIRNAVEGLQPGQNGLRSGLLRVRHKDGAWRSVEAIGKNLLDVAGVNGIVGNFRDITERKQTEEALRESEERYRRLVELSPDTIFVQRDGKIVFINAAGVKLLGAASSQDLIGKPVLDLIHPYYRPMAIEQILQAKNPSPEATPVHEKMVRLDTSTVDVEMAATPFTDDKDRPAAQVIARDITARRRAEEQLRRSHEQLRALTAHLQSVREEERTRIAREIHDELGQELTALKMDLSALDKKIQKLDPLQAEPLQKRTESMFDLIDQTIRNVRRISTELRPGILDDLGLAAAIEWQTQEFEHRTGIQSVCSSCVEDIRLDRDRATAIFRIFQEALTNVARHAKASEVRIALTEESGFLILTISDNGKGITPEQVADPKSLGILGMRERALLFGGEVRIVGSSTAGSTVSVVLPAKSDTLSIHIDS